MTHELSISTCKATTYLTLRSSLLVPSKEAVPLSIAPQLEILMIEREEEKGRKMARGKVRRRTCTHRGSTATDQMKTALVAAAVAATAAAVAYEAQQQQSLSSSSVQTLTYCS